MDEHTTFTTVQDGVTVGANATIGSDLVLGRFAVVGMGAVVTRSVRALHPGAGQPRPARGARVPLRPAHREPPRRGTGRRRRTAASPVISRMRCRTAGSSATRWKPEHPSPLEQDRPVVVGYLLLALCATAYGVGIVTQSVAARRTAVDDGVSVGLLARLARDRITSSGSPRNWRALSWPSTRG